MRLRIALLVGMLLATLLVQAPAQASFHLNKIVEVFGGTAAEPDAQYVEIQMYSSGQNFVGGHDVIISNATGTDMQTFTFASQVANGADQDSILVATTQAETLFGLQADLEMNPVIDPAGGKVCFDTIDCASWGSFAADPSAGDAFAPETGLPNDAAMGRDTSGGSDPNELDAGDDTNDSAADFLEVQALPTNNARLTGHLPGEEPPPPTDTTPPVVRIVKPADSVVYRAAKLSTWTGNVEDDSADPEVFVGLRMTKKNGSCRWWTGTEFEPRGCNNRVDFHVVVDGSGRWTFDAPRLKPSIGTKIKHYTAFARAVDQAGNPSATERAANRNTFEIKR